MVTAGSQHGKQPSTHWESLCHSLTTSIDFLFLVGQTGSRETLCTLAFELLFLVSFPPKTSLECLKGFFSEDPAQTSPPYKPSHVELSFFWALIALGIPLNYVARFTWWCNYSLCVCDSYPPHSRLEVSHGLMCVRFEYHQSLHSTPGSQQVLRKC